MADHLRPSLTFASPDWSLERAAEAMVRGGFRHLVVVDGGEIVGVLSMRDIVRCWVTEGATSELPGPSRRGRARASAPAAGLALVLERQLGDVLRGSP